MMGAKTQAVVMRDSAKSQADTPDESRKPDSSSAKPNATKGKPQVKPGGQG